MQNRHIDSASGKRYIGIVSTESQFKTRQALVREALYAVMHEQKNRSSQKRTPISFEDRTGWLPGPLSYPWILFILGIPILSHLFL